MNRSRIVYWKRIGVSAVIASLSVLLVCVCIRSYWTNDMVGYNGITLGANGGTVYLARISAPVGGPGLSFEPPSGWHYHKIPAIPSEKSFDFQRSATVLTIKVPHWLLILSFAVLAFVPWLPWWSPRFSIRTLLFVTTLVAVVLGLLVWAVR